MTKFGKVLMIIGVIIVVVVVLYFAQKQPAIAPVVNAPEENNNVVEVPVSDLVSFSVVPNSTLFGVVNYNGTIKGGYFFEANILINILDLNQNVLKAGNATATSDWMTAGPVDFAGTIDLTGLPPGPAYFQIHNDNASGLPENDKSILIPITIQ